MTELETEKTLKLFMNKYGEIFEKYVKLLNEQKEIKSRIDWLESHNKNYTKAQYYKILEIQEIIKEV